MSQDWTFYVVLNFVFEILDEAIFGLTRYAEKYSRCPETKRIIEFYVFNWTNF